MDRDPILPKKAVNGYYNTGIYQIKYPDRMCMCSHTPSACLVSCDSTGMECKSTGVQNDRKVKPGVSLETDTHKEYF